MARNQNESMQVKKLYALLLAAAAPLTQAQSFPLPEGCIFQMPPSYLRVYDSGTSFHWVQDEAAVVNAKLISEVERSHTKIVIVPPFIQALDYRSPEVAKQALALLETKMKECK